MYFLNEFGVFSSVEIWEGDAFYGRNCDFIHGILDINQNDSYLSWLKDISKALNLPISQIEQIILENKK